MITTDRAAEQASPTLRLISAGITAYQSVFVKSRLAPLLSRPNPVRNSGFEMILTIGSVTAEGPDVVSLELVDPAGTQLPKWTPGAHVDVLLPSGKQRQYSLCGDPADRSRYRIAVRRIATGLGGSREMHELTAGMTIDVVGPRNAFPLITAESYLFIAGGIGITPILPMVRQCHERGIPWRLVYLGRSRETMPFLGELAQYPSGQVEIRPDEEFGLPDVTHVIPTAAQGSAIYVCGPTPLMTTARGLMREINPSGSLHTERFSALPVVNGTPFEVTLQSTGVTVQVGAYETALAAIRREIPGVAYSCQQGFCGTCRARVCDGVVDHRDKLLTPGERAETMLTCVSRSAGGLLVLDL